MLQTALTRRSTRLINNNRAGIDHPAPQILFYLIVATIPFFELRQLPGPEFMKVDWLLTAALLLIIGPYLVMSKGPPIRLRSNLWFPLGLFLLANIVSFAFSPFSEQANAGLIQLLQILLFIAIATLILNDRGLESTLPWVLGLSVGLNASLSILGYFFGLEVFTQEGGRAYGATSSANNMALMCVFTLPLMIHFMIYASAAPARLLAAFLVLTLVFGVFSTVSRGGFLNLIAVLALTALQYRNHFHPRYLGLLVAGLAIGMTLIITLVPQSFFDRQASLITEGTEDRSISRRSYYLQVGMDAVAERTAIGWGPTTFQSLWVESAAALRFDREKRPAHNTYVEVAVGSGLLGLLTFGALIFRTYRNYANAERSLADRGCSCEAHLIGAYKAGFTAVMVYFLFKSGIEHKHFLLAVPLSYLALLYARDRIRTSPAPVQEEQ